jgi:hypothetical protein
MAEYANQERTMIHFDPPALLGIAQARLRENRLCDAVTYENFRRFLGV